MKNKSKQEIDLTHEGEALVDHLALNALLLRHAKEKISNEGMYVTIAGVEPGGDASCTAAAARCNALGENLGLDPDGRPPVTMLSAPRMPYTVVRDDYPSHIWHLVFVVPPPTGAGPTRLMKRNEQLVSDLAEAMSFSRRTGTRLGVVGVELEGTHTARGGGGGGGGGDVGGARPGHPPRDRRRGRERDALETAEGRSGGRGRGGGAKTRVGGGAGSSPQGARILARGLDARGTHPARRRGDGGKRQQERGVGEGVVRGVL